MTGERLPADVKRTSALRRMPPLDVIQLQSVCAGEGDVCAFELPLDEQPITVESPAGRMMTIAPGDPFLATPGYRESTRWVDGRVPAEGLIPGNHYSVLADSGVVGELVGFSPMEQGHPARLRYLGAVCSDRSKALNLRHFAISFSPATDHNAQLYLLLGTSGNVGKTTAGVAILRTLLLKGYRSVIALKATGTSSFSEIATYLDFGATQVFDCVDFGLPTTYPTGRSGIGDIFANALDFCLSLPVEAVVVECGGDLFGASVPEFLTCLKARRSKFKVILSAADALGALGAKGALAEIGLSISLITGPCTDTPTLRQRTKTLCGIPTMNLIASPNREP